MIEEKGGVVAIVVVVVVMRGGNCGCIDVGSVSSDIGGGSSGVVSERVQDGLFINWDAFVWLIFIINRVGFIVMVVVIAVGINMIKIRIDSVRIGIVMMIAGTTMAIAT